MGYPEFQAMIGPARLYPELWRLVLGFWVVGFCYLGATALLAVVLFFMVGPMEYFSLLQRITVPREAGPTLLLLVTFSGMLLGPVLAAGACHFRGPATLFGSWSEFRRGFATVIVATLPVYAVLLALGLGFGGARDNLAWADWARWLPYALPLILLQVTAEETLFRGYFVQQLAARFAARWVWMGLPSLIFGLMHWNPTAGPTVWLAMFTAFVFALVATDLTARTGSLGAAVGLHFANNAFGILAISVSGGITGLARWVTPFGMGDSGPAALSLAMNVAMLVLVWRLLVWVLDR